MRVDSDKRLVYFKGGARNQWHRCISTKSYNKHCAVGVSLDELLARLLQYALLEIGPLAEELLVRGGGRMLRVFDSRELHGADVVRRLRKPVLGGLRGAVDNRVLRQRVLDHEVKGLGDGVLDVVVVNLDRVVGLKLREVAKQEVHDIPAHRPRELIERGVTYIVLSDTHARDFDALECIQRRPRGRYAMPNPAA